MWWLIPVVIVISFLAVAVSFYITVSVKIVNQYLTPVKRTDEFLVEYESREKGLDKSLLSVPFTEMKLKSRFGYELRARYFPSETPSDKTVLDFHGHNSSGVSQLKYLKIFRSLGYNVFIPDHRFSGASGGRSITFGDFETEDAILWVEELKRRYPDTKFGIYGESMGGAIAIRVAERIKPTFLISYAAYNTILQLFNDHSKNKAKYFMPMIDFVAHLKTGARLKKINGEKSIRGVDCPILLMHSKADTLIPVTHEKKLYEAAVSAEKDVREYIFEASKHTRSFSIYPDEFTRCIENFIRYSEGGKEV